MDYIFMSTQRVGGTYLPGDLADLEEMLKAKVVNEMVIRHLKTSRIIEPLSEETFAIAAARRPHDAPWPPRGMTEAYLEERGYARPEKVEPREPEGVIKTVTLTEDAVKVGENYLQPEKRGNITFWTPTDANGRILRSKMFRDQEKGREFLELLSTPDDDADTSAEDGGEEQGNDGDLQSGSDDAPGQGAAEDRGH